MSDLAHDVATLALEQARTALLAVPTDASPSQRSNVVTTAVRAITAYRETHASPPEVHPEQEGPESPA